MIRTFITKFKANLNFALDEKTNWGRNDIKALILKVIADTLLEVME